MLKYKQCPRDWKIETNTESQISDTPGIKCAEVQVFLTF